MRASRQTRLDDAAERFEEWRRTGGAGRRRIPDGLWRAAVGLVGEYSASSICERLRRNPSRFREAGERPGDRSEMTAGVGRNTPAPQFVELSPVRPPAEAASWRVVIQQADGLQVQLDFRTVDASSVEAARHLVQALVLERDGVR